MKIEGRRRSNNVIDLRGFESITTMWGFNRYGVRGGGLGGGLTADQQLKKTEAEMAALTKRVEAEVSRKPVEDAVTRDTQKRQAEIAQERHFDAAIAASKKRAEEQKQAVQKLQAYLSAAQKKAALKVAARLASKTHNPGRYGGR